MSEEIYSLGRTIWGLTRLEIDLTDDWEFNRKAEKQQVGKDCCRSVAAELLSIGRRVYSQTVLILISFNLSQFIVWAIKRSVIPNKLSKIVPYLGMVTSALWVTTQLIWVSWGCEVLRLRVGSDMFERQPPRSAWATWKKTNLLYSSYAADRECVSFGWPLWQAQQAKRCEELAPNRITWLRLLSLTGSLPQPEETVAVYCINKSAIYIRK